MIDPPVFVPEVQPTPPVDAVAAKFDFPRSYMSWGPSIAGAIVAASTLFVLMTFASAIGLAVTSASPTWRDTAVGLTLLSGVWILFSAVGSLALGGYIAGRIRTTWQTNADEVHFRDGLHGLVVWALAVIIGVALTWASAATLERSSETTTDVKSGKATTVEPRFLTFELDRLYRSDRRPAGDDTQARAEAGRIIQTGLGRRSLAKDDQDYLVRLVATHTGLTPLDAGQRVAQIMSESREAAAKARRSAVILAFTIAAALAAAAAAAWSCAVVGGKHRDGDVAPSMYFARRRIR